jgi:autotransporter-associated beta strand protein
MTSGRRNRRRGRIARRGMRGGMMVAAALLTRAAPAAGIIDLGLADEFTLSQPVVQVAVSEGRKTFDLWYFNECLLDTGASGILMGKTASEFLRQDGFREEATYVDFGVAGPQSTGVSAPYTFSYAGADGVPLSLSEVRIQTAGTDFGFYAGIAGMPLMMGRSVGLDLARQADMNVLRMGVEFGTGLAAPAAHQYSVPLTMYEFPMTGKVNPDDPLPVYAPLPFAPVELQYGNTRRESSFLVDTGAQQCIISSAFAFELGLDVNGNGDLLDEAVSFQEVIGVGGSKVIPILAVDALAIKTTGADIVLRDIAVGIIDIDEALSGVLGMNILNAGWEIYQLNTFLGIQPVGPPGVFDRVDFDFTRAADTLQGEMRLTVRADVDVAASQGPVAIDVAAGTVGQAAAGHATVAGIGSLTKTGPGTLVLDAVNTLTGPTTVAAGTLEVAAVKSLVGSPVTVSAGATLAIPPGVTPRIPSVTLSGGTLVAESLSIDAGRGIGSLSVAAGGLAGRPAVTVGVMGRLALASESASTIAVSSLDVSAEAGGFVDLGGGRIEIGGGATKTGLRDDLRAARAGGDWSGRTGIGSTAPGMESGFRTVGYKVAADGSAVVAFAAPGDLDLNGAVDVFDLVALRNSGLFGTTTAAHWADGDMNYDGLANLFDLVAISAGGAFGEGSYLPGLVAAAASTAVVPEPGFLAAVLGGVAAWLTGRRGRSSRG